MAVFTGMFFQTRSRIRQRPIHEQQMISQKSQTRLTNMFHVKHISKIHLLLSYKAGTY